MYFLALDSRHLPGPGPRNFQPELPLNLTLTHAPLLGCNACSVQTAAVGPATLLFSAPARLLQYTDTVTCVSSFCSQGGVSLQHPGFIITHGIRLLGVLHPGLHGWGGFANNYVLCSWLSWIIFVYYSYAIMSDCWHEVPERRPTFTDLVNRLELLLNPPKPHPQPSEVEEPTYINVADTEARDYLDPINSKTSPVAWDTHELLLHLISSPDWAESLLWLQSGLYWCSIYPQQQKG